MTLIPRSFAGLSSLRYVQASSKKLKKKEDGAFWVNNWRIIHENYCVADFASIFEVADRL